MSKCIYPEFGFSNFFSNTVLNHYCIEYENFSLSILQFLRVLREYRESMENTTNSGLYAVQKIISENAEGIYAYMEKTLRETTVYISVNNKMIVKFF